MSTNYLALRSSAAPTLTVSTLLGSTIAARSISLQSTTISLGQSTNQSYTNFSNGSFTTGWASTLTGLTSIKDVVLSPNGSIQTILQNSGSTMSTTFTSLNSGSTWTGSTMRGLPTSGALPYQTYGSTINAMTVPSITAITAAPSGTNQLAIASNELVYASVNSGATFAATGLGQNNSPFIYIPFDGSSVADVMGNSVVTATGSPAYVAGKVGTNAVNLNNSAAVGGTATQYVRGTWAGSNAFTVSFWFNAQTINASQAQYIFSSYNSYLAVNIATNNTLNFVYPTGNTYAVFTGPVIAANTWYNVVGVVQSGGLCSFYVNNTLITSTTNTVITTPTTLFSLGCFDTSTSSAFNGYIDDFRLYNYAVTNPSGAALINPLVGPIMPYVYLTFDGSTTTDVMGNSTTTATGSPGFVTGQVGSNAVNLVNTAGGTPSNFIRGTISATTSFTVSGWVNFQTVSTSGVVPNTVFSIGTGSQTFLYLYYINGTGLQFQFFNSSSATITVGTQASISTGTWYNFNIIYNQTGTCYFYLNNTLIGSTAGSALLNTMTTYTIGSYTHAAYGAFNGYIDDLRIYTGAFFPSQLSPVLYSPSYAIGSPNIYLPFENGSVLDTMGYSAISARGTMNFVPGVVGTSALNLVNPAGGTAVNYLRGSWAGSPNFTVSFWFNAQALGVRQIVWGAYQGYVSIEISSANQLQFIVPNGGATSTVVATSSPISINTWYNITGVFQSNGQCMLYLNGTLIGTYTNSGGVGSLSTSSFGVGEWDTLTSTPFNGYIDDFKLYNCAVPFNALGPMNYTQAAISNSGAYQVVAAANGGVYTSANSGSTWSQAVTSPQPAPAVNTVGGQVITPNLASLAANTWTQNGVNWVASASTVYSNAVYYLFNTVADNWASALNTYNSTTGFYAGLVTTVTQNAGTISGEWFQIQSSVPVVASSYSYIPFNMACTAKTYFILGSNDGSTWYAIQSASYGATNPCTNGSTPTSAIIVNSSSVQTVTAGATGSLTTAAYSTTTNAYTYFRLVGTTTWTSSPAAFMQYGEFYFNFATPPTPLYVAPSTALITNQSLNAITVMPQQTGLASSTWTTNGISWVSSASTTMTTNYPYFAFNNTTITGAFYTGNFYNGNTGAYTGSLSTAISGLSAATGEWLQIQSSAPLVMNSYTFACTGWWQLAKTGFIVGSTDGTTWYAIQSFTMTTNPFTANYLTASNYITIGPTGTQTQAVYGNQAGSGSFTGYATSSNAYTYFRFIASTISGASTNTNAANNDGFGPAEWYINFTAYTPALLQSLSMSPSGQYMALTGAGAVAPQLTGLSGSTGTSPVTTSWTTNGATWTSSASTVANPNLQPWVAFNNFAATTTSPATYSWASIGYSIGVSGYNSSGVYQGPASTTVLLSVGAVTGEWIQIQSSVPLIMSSYTFACGDYRNYPNNYFIVGSTDGTNWYPIQSVTTSTNPFTVGFTAASTYLTVSQAGTQPIQGNVSGSAACVVYSTTGNAFTYFRLIARSTFGGPNGNFELTEWYINFQSGSTFYSTDYGSSWTRSLTAATIPNANVFATSGNGQYSLQASGQTVFIAINTSGGNPTGSYTTPTFSPALSSATGTVSNAAVSASGQYMVVLTQGSSNNVYYSSNYGVSFTGITLGSTAMVSCAVSADGSYITVANQTQVFTLNSNTQGLSITVGNQSGLINQGQNAVAIGNQAGQINQSANSIVLNSSGTAVNAYVPGFFVAPVALAGSSVSSSLAVLGYGTDNQVVQTGLSIRADGTFTGTASFAGNVGFGTTAPTTLLNLYAPASSSWPFILNYSSGLQLVLGNGGVSSSIMFDTFNTITGTRPPLCLNNSGGNVGIGITNPSTALHVKAFTGYSTPGQAVIFESAISSVNKEQRLTVLIYNNDATGGSSFGSYSAIQSAMNNVANTPLVLQPNGSLVGIGITNPSTQLSISGTAYTSGGTSSITNVSNFNGTASMTLNAPSASGANNSVFMGCNNLGGGGGAGIVMWRGSSYDTYLQIYTNVSTNTASGAGGLTAGPYVTNGSGAWTNASDMRLKENWLDIDNVLDKLLVLTTGTFQWKNQTDRPRCYGLIAQEVQLNFPEMIGKDQQGYLGIQYTDMIPVVIKAIQVLTNKNTELTQKLDSLLAWAQTQGFTG